MRIARENILATTGDQGVYGAGLDVFTADGYLKPNPGQLFIWDPKTRLSLGVGATVATNDKIVISVARDRTSFRSVFGDQVFGCAIDAVTAKGATCGTPDIWDIYWDCLNCGDKVSLNITVKDDKSFNEYPFNRGATYSHTMKLPDCPCDTCSTETDQFRLACEIRDTINANGLTDAGRRPIFNKKNFNEDVPYTAHVLYGGTVAVQGDPSQHPTTFVYCIDPTPISGCTGCISVDGPAFTTATFGGEVGTTVTFDGVSSPTLLAQLDSIADQITAGLAGYGSAVVTKGAGICCPYRLEVNTCYEDFKLTGYTPCEQYNPFATPYTADTTCLNCDVNPTGKVLKYGVRIVSKPVKYDCSCFPNVDGISLMLRTLQINAVGFPQGGFYKRQVSAASAPTNLGYQWVKRDVKSDNGGDGRNHDPFTHLGYGTFGTGLLGRGREDIMTTCDVSYCSYIIEHGIPSKTTSFHGDPTSTKGRSIILIPTSDTTTIADFEAIFNGYITSSGCPVKDAVTCGVEIPG